MGRISFYFLFLISAIILYLFLIHEVPSHYNYLLNGSAKRAALEIITGSVAHSPAPSPESPPPSTPLLPPAPPPAPSSSAHAPAPPPELPPNIVQDSRTIQEFGNTITDDPFDIKKSWSGQNVCDFKGFACDIRPDKGILSVAALDFNGYNFNGSDFQIKDLLEDLTDLAIFHANSNNFTGEVSKEVGVKNINYLYELDLSNNKYTGGFPKSVLEAKNLTFLDLRFNSFSGQVPREVFNLDLDVLFLNNNRFSRQLPHNVGNTSALYLTFANNFFTGPIPRSIGSARNLLEVLFLNNNFSGCIPYEIGLLANTTLFDVSQNKLTGPIPYSFACLAKMQILNLARNKFYGAVPEMICKLPNLQNLSLSHNYFTQVGVECRKLIALKRLDVRYNCIYGFPHQRSEDECTAFFSKKRRCSNEKSLTHIPCRKNWYLSSLENIDDQQSMVIAAPPPPRSYHALIPENMLRY